LAEWGSLAYAVAAVWAFFEGESFVLAAAALGAVAGGVDPWLLLGSAWVGAFVSDQAWFAAGRRWGPAMLRRSPRTARLVTAMQVPLARHGTLFVLGLRFLYGVRNFGAAACGMAGLGWPRFAALDAVAAALWAGTLVAAGWFLGEWLGPAGLGWSILAVAMLALAGLGFRHWRQRARLPG
jgi:membrane protein DedA with SNARE-associated domain